jgi:hypothetical protein
MLTTIYIYVVLQMATESRSRPWKTRPFSRVCSTCNLIHNQNEKQVHLFEAGLPLNVLSEEMPQIEVG